MQLAMAGFPELIILHRQFQLFCQKLISVFVIDLQLQELTTF